MRRKLILAFLISVSSILPAQAEWLIAECSAYTPYDCGTITATGETVHVGGVACNFLPKEDTVLTTLQPTGMVIGKRPCGRVLEKPDGSEYPYLLDDSYFGYFNRDAEIKVNPAAKTSVFYIFENNELVCVVAPIRRKK